MALKEEKPKRKGGRRQKKKEIKNAPIIHNPPLERKIPVYDVISDEQVERIHDFAMDVVEQVGCEFRDESVLDIWKKTDAEIKGENVKLDNEHASLTSCKEEE